MRRPKQPDPAQQRAAAMKWNAEHAIGTAVSVKQDDGSVLRTRTRAEASVLPSGIAVVFLVGVSGAYLLSRCTAIAEQLQAA